MPSIVGWRMEPTGGTPTSLIRPAPGYVDSKALTPGGAAVSFTVPAGARVALFGANGDFYANGFAAAAVPGNIADGSAAEFKPSAWGVEGVTTISVISPAGGGATVVTVSYYGKN